MRVLSVIKPSSHDSTRSNFLNCLMTYMILGIAAVGQAQTSKDTPKLLDALERFPQADTNGDNVLNTKEIGDGITSLKGTSRAVTYTAAEVVEFRNDGKSVSLREAQAEYRNTTQMSADSL